MAEELLSALLCVVTQPPPSLRRRRAVVHAYRRVPVKHGEYPALVPGDPTDCVEGYVVEPIESVGQWAALDEFEGDEYRREVVRVVVEGEVDCDDDNDDNEQSREVAAQTYVWTESTDQLKMDEDWVYADFIKRQLQEWLDEIES
jgi:hypothetical protein